MSDPADFEATELARANCKKCSLCGSTESGFHRGWMADHDHETGRFRGMLCIRCNTALGWFDKGWSWPDPRWLFKYLLQEKAVA